MINNTTEKTGIMIADITNHYKKNNYVAPNFIAIINSNYEKPNLFEIGFIDYVNYPIIQKELTHRIQQGIYSRCILKSSNCNCLIVNKTDKLTCNKRTLIVNRVISYINSNIDQVITLNSISRNSGVNRNELTHIFKSNYNTTIMRWLKMYRLQMAADQLINTSFSILQISENIGYSDPNNFSTSFKKAFKITPREYRKNGNI